MMAQYLKAHPDEPFEKLKFKLEFVPDDLLTLSSGAQISNIHFSVTDGRRNDGA